MGLTTNLGALGSTVAGKYAQDAAKLMENLLAEQRMTNRMLYTLMTPEQRHELDESIRSERGR